MSFNSTPSAERVHIGFFGLRNAGKSSVVNAVTAQELSLVSDVKGTTTDPVRKAMELLPIGPVVIIDTPGTDDEGALGEQRVKRAMKTLDETDIAVLVIDAEKGETQADEELKKLITERKIPLITVYNKADLLPAVPTAGENTLYVSAASGTNIFELKEMLGRIAADGKKEKRLIGDLLQKDDIVVLVTPIDESAPKGRMILPQQQTIRDVLDSDAVCLVTKETQLETLLSSLPKKPRLVVTDSQAFGFVNKVVPKDIPLTSFSMLFARYKGDLFALADGADTLDKLRDGDRVLISEGCTHHRQCNDIGTVKLPNWVKKYTDRNIVFDFTSGRDFPEDVSEYSLVIHCGGCMLNDAEISSRAKRAKAQGVPMTNYGTAIAKMHGILERAIKPLKK
jgi:[FeFe] hydrogenase H-cluster maturation GTPase HydF